MSCTVSVIGGDNGEMRTGVKSKMEEFCQQAMSTRTSTTYYPDNPEREKLMRDVVDYLDAAYPEYNIMVVHPAHHKNLNECTHVQVKLAVPEHGIEKNFQVYVFKSGDFTLEGDGGFINWCFKGEFIRDDKKLQFSERE